VLFVTEVPYIHMNTEERKLKGLSVTRFEAMIFLFRMAGFPFQMKKISNVYAVYMITVNICNFSTFLGVLFDAYVHRDDMTTIRMLIPYTNVMWLSSYCR
jgi:hypothetical protein